MSRDFPPMFKRIDGWLVARGTTRKQLREAWRKWLAEQRASSTTKRGNDHE